MSDSDSETDNKGKELYLNPRTGYWSKSKMVKKYRKMLDKMDSIQRHKQVKKKTKAKIYKKIQAKYPLYQIQVDLAFLPKLKSPLNRNVIGFMVVIDVFSRYLWIKKLYNRAALHNQLEEVIIRIKNETGKAPENITLDNEFATTLMHDMVAKYNSELHFSDAYEKHRTGMSERVILSIKNLIKRYITQNNTTKYIDVLDDLVYNYNHTIHRMIKTTPAEALKTGKTMEKREPRYDSDEYSSEEHVRVERKRDPVKDKGDVPRYKKQAYKIVGRDKNRYVLQDVDSGEQVQKRYARHQLQKIDAIDKSKVIKKKSNNVAVRSNIRPNNVPVRSNIHQHRQNVSQNNNNSNVRQNVRQNVPQNNNKTDYEDEMKENSRINKHKHYLKRNSLDLNKIVDKNERKQAKKLAGIDRTEERVKQVKQKIGLRRSTRIRKKPDRYVPQDNRK